MSDETLIQLVKKYTVLYDSRLPDYRDTNARNIAWEEISQKLNIPVEECKIRWTKLRNCYTNAIKRFSRKIDKVENPMLRWKYEKQMEFLAPYVDPRPQKVNFRSLNNIKIIPRTVIQKTAIPSNTNNDENNFIREILETMKKSNDIRLRRSISELDESDLFFLSISKQVKKFPAVEQSRIKFQIHEMIHDIEMHVLNPDDVMFESATEFITDTSTRNKEKENVFSNPTEILIDPQIRIKEERNDAFESATQPFIDPLINTVKVEENM